MSKISKLLESLLGNPQATETVTDGTVRVFPRTAEECALVVTTSNSEGWTVSVQGNGTWNHENAPSDVVISTKFLDEITELNPSDMLATAGAGTSWRALQMRAANAGMWIPSDPPGGERTLGSVLATGTAGPLQCGFGQIRRQVLGLTLVCGDGRLVRVGGKVVKNVAGFDLRKLAVGGFSAYGIVTSAHLRLCALPQTDKTFSVTANRDQLLESAAAILESGLTPASLELVSPEVLGGSDWTLLLRLTGSTVLVDSETIAVDTACNTKLAAFDEEQAKSAWETLYRGPSRLPVSIRIGSSPSSLGDTLDLIQRFLDSTTDGWLACCLRTGVIRWCGTASAREISALRQESSARFCPLTVERAPWKILEAVGHFGTYQPGVGSLVASLRRAYDSNNTMVVPLEAIT